MMKAAWRRSLSVFLVLAMMVTVCLSTGSETWATELDAETITEEIEETESDGTDAEDVEITPSEGEAQDTSDVEIPQDTEEEPGDDVSIADTDESEVPEETELTEDLEEEDSEEAEIEVLSEIEIVPGESVSADVTMKYDDYVSLTDCTNGIDLSEYGEPEITKQDIQSYQVNQGSVGAEDEAVVDINEETGKIHAVGVGTATLVWTKINDAGDGNIDDESDIDAGSQDDEEGETGGVTTEDTFTMNVTVTKAPLTVMFVAGQSNAEGEVSSGSYADSIVCEEGQVYSTYAPSSSSRAVSNTGLSMGECTASNAASYVAGSLTGDVSLSGSSLTYKLNALTNSGNGKTGMDSGLAYKWNKLTGDKVWVVNAGSSASSITTWVPGNSNYSKALAVFQDAMQTARAEDAAGHYTIKDTLLFWLQGENDKNMSASDYMSYYNEMYQGLSNADLGIEYHGIIMVRACTGSYTDSTDLYMTGPRIAQYMMGNSSSYSNIYVVSNANEQWVTDSGVKNYFSGADLSYSTHSGSPSMPTTVSAVHGDIHYSQIGHNENGISAAKGMYQIVCGGASASSISWYDEDGTALPSGTQLDMGNGETGIYIPVASPVYASKGMTIDDSSSVFSYDISSGILTVNGSGDGTLIASVGGASSSLEIIGSGALDTPVLKSAVAANDGTITVTWNSVSGATGYRVFRKTSGGSWSSLGWAESTSTSYTDSNIEAGKTYIYTVRAYRGAQSKALANTYSSIYWSSYDSKGVSAAASAVLATPTLISATVSLGSINISWKSVSGATGYRVFRKTSGGSWSSVGWATTNSYSDSNLEIGTTYIYTVRAYKGDQTTASKNTYYAAYWSGYDSSGVSAKATGSLDTPTLNSATVSAGSVMVAWDPVDGATGYRVFRKTSGGSWSSLNWTMSTNYTDSDVEAGKTYIYTVRAYCGTQTDASANTYSSTYWSGYDKTGVSANVTAALNTPTLNSATVSGSSVTIKWSSVSGASGYRVFRKKSGGSWSSLGWAPSTSYTDSNLEVGTTYIYTVRAYVGDQDTASKNTYKASYWSGYSSSGVSATIKNVLATPVLKSATASVGSIEVTWNSVDGATGYRVFRKTASGGWSSLGWATTTSYTDSAIETGTTYIYTVRAYIGDKDSASKNTYDGNYWSSYDSAGVSAKAVSELSTPSLISATASAGTITVKWNAVSGADGYTIYRKVSGGSWSKIGTTTTETSYTDSYNFSTRTTYIYTVRAFKGTEKDAMANQFSVNYWSHYDSTGVSAQSVSTLTTPTLTSATQGSSGVTVTWNSVSGASGYRVFRKVSGGSWSSLGLTTSPSYTDTSSLSSSTTYYYTVRAYKGDQATALKNTYTVNYWSDYDSNGIKYTVPDSAQDAMVNKAQSYSSSTKWMVMVNCTTNRAGIFYGSKGNWELQYYWQCSTGKPSTPTVKGTYSIQSKGKSFSGVDYTCWYYSQFYGNYLLHSVLYQLGSSTQILNGTLGENISHGCVRLAKDNAQWIYNNVPIGSRVVTYSN